MLTQVTWAELISRFTDPTPLLVRGTASTDDLDMLATIAMYESEAKTENGLSPTFVEQRIQTAVDAGQFPAGDATDLLCHRRAVRGTGQRGPTRHGPGRDRRHRAGGHPVQPGHPRRRRLRAVRPHPGGPPAARAVPLRHPRPGHPVRRAPVEHPGSGSDDDGTRACGRRLPGLADVGRGQAGDRRSRPARAGRRVPDRRWLGSRPERVAAVRSGASRNAGRTPTWTGIRAQQPSSLLFAVDSSGSMGAAASNGTRQQVAAAAILSGLEALGSQDEFALWTFSTAAESGHVEGVPMGLRDDRAGWPRPTRSCRASGRTGTRRSTAPWSTARSRCPGPAARTRRAPSGPWSCSPTARTPPATSAPRRRWRWRTPGTSASSW